MSKMTILINVLLLVANLCVFGLSLKLYTEYFKDRSQATRKGPADVGPGRSSE